MIQTTCSQAAATAAGNKKQDYLIIIIIKVAAQGSLRCSHVFVMKLFGIRNSDSYCN